MGEAMTALNIDCIVRRGSGLLEAEVDGEVVALSVDKGMCYGLNKVGSRVWALIGEPMRIRDICAVLVREYAVDQATCEQQVLELLEELLGEGMIDIREPSAP